MKNVLLIAHNDVRVFLRFKVGYVWLFLVPFFFVYTSGVGFRGGGAPSNPRPSLIVENRDRGFLGPLFREELGAQGMNLLSAEQRNEAQRGVTIPADFTEKVLHRLPTRVDFFQKEGSEMDAAALIELRVARAVISLNAHLLELALQTNSSQPLTEAGLRDVMARTNPVSLKAEFAGRRPTPAGFNQSLPGTLVMFLMMNLLIFGGTSVAAERTNGVLRRMAIHPLRKWEIVLGKVYGRFLLGTLQIVFLLLAGRFVFRVNIGENAVALLAVLAIYAWVAASLGVLIGSITRHQDQTTGLCVVSSMVMAALGGCWWPLEIVSDFMHRLGLLFPTAWAMQALHQLISFGGDFRTILPHLGVLTLFAVTANLAAAKVLRF